MALVDGAGSYRPRTHVWVGGGWSQACDSAEGRAERCSRRPPKADGLAVV